MSLIPKLTDVKITDVGLSPSSFGNNFFQDVKDNKWYAKELQTARVKGLIKTTDGRLFRPEEPITREEMAIFMERAIRIEEKTRNTVTTTLSDEKILEAFADNRTISPDARQAMAAAVTKKLIAGRAAVVNGKKTSSLAPRSGASRAEALTVLYRLFNLLQ